MIENWGLKLSLLSPVSDQDAIGRSTGYGTRILSFGSKLASARVRSGSHKRPFGFQVANVKLE